MTQITIRVEQSQVIVTSPYHPQFPKPARNLGGQWDKATRTWRFDARDESRVRALCMAIYGTDGSRPGDLVTLQITTATYEWYAERAPLYCCGRKIAWADGRDSGAEIGPGVIVKSGELTSGGSRVNWRTIARPNTVFLLRDVPRGAATALADDLPYGIVSAEVVVEAPPPTTQELLGREVEVLVERYGLEQVTEALTRLLAPPTVTESPEITFETRDAQVATYTGGSLEPLARGAYESMCQGAGVEPKADERLYAADLYRRDDLFPESLYAKLSLPDHVALIFDYRRALDIARHLPEMPAHQEWQWRKRQLDEEAIMERYHGRGPLRTCIACGQSGYDGQYPFSTLPGGHCDDCI